MMRKLFITCARNAGFTGGDEPRVLSRGGGMGWSRSV